MANDTASSPATTFLAGGGEMGERMRAYDWPATPLGSPEIWPQSLRSTVSLLLPSKSQIIAFWGPEFTVLYNDAYRPVFGAKHPHALGLPGRAAWSEIWDGILHDLLAGVIRTGEAFWAKDLLFKVERFGFVEETYFDVSYDPVRVESGAVGGVLCIVSETTERVIGERRMELLKELAARNATARTTRAACELATETLAARPQDVTFALISLDGQLQSATPGAQERLAGSARDKVWHLPVSAGAGGPSGQLVVGLNLERPFDERYRGFLDLVADQLTTALSNSRAYEEERKRAEALAEIDRAKTVFFSNVSHEFRTPLTLLLGPVQDAMAGQDQSLNGEALATVHRNALRLLKLVNTLLDFARIEAGRAQAAYEATDLPAFTRDLAGAFRSAIESAGLQFNVNCDPCGEPAHVDRSMWEKIVFNLLSNALKFTFEGSINLHLSRAGDGFRLIVRDTGVGIPAEEVPNLFRRFHRVRATRARTHEGSGIGLALVQELVRLHGGTIDVESRSGQGTTFTVRLPLHADHLGGDAPGGSSREPSPTSVSADAYVNEALGWMGKTESTAAASADDRPRARILLADDNADMRAYVGRLLADRWHVDAVSDGAAALRAVGQRVPDVIVADVMMPELDGFGMLSVLRADRATRDIPVILLSARAGEEASLRGIEAGADDYLVKPFTARELLARVDAQVIRAQVLKARKRDEEALRRSEQELLEANRVKDEFLATLSHELRTPLNAVLGWAHLLRTGALRPEAQERALQSIERNAVAQAQLVDDLLDVSRIISGKLAIRREPLDLTAVVAAAVDAIRPAAAANKLQLQVETDPGSEFIVEGDHARLQQVVTNLLSNAVKFTPAGGRIDVGLHAADGWISLVVRDTGDGIAPTLLPHVFDRFRQGDSTKSRKHGGLGLGLAIVRHLTEAHGGTVSAQSDGEDAGAVFIVRLPSSRSQRRSSSTPSPPRASTEALRGVRVLVVDDDRDARELARVVIETHGGEATAAASAAEALRLLEQHRFDVLVTDIGMPDQDGHSLMHSIRTREADKGVRIRAIALSAYATPRDRDESITAGFDDHLAKPAEASTLVTRIAGLIESSKTS